MTLATILREKRTSKDILLNTNDLSNNKLSLGLININSKLINDVFLDALKILPANFIINTNNNLNGKFNNISCNNVPKLNNGFDFIVCDDCESNISKYLSLGIVPVIGKSHHISSILKEFNASQIEGNAFIFENNALCDIYYAIIRYLENYKFPYDNKALVKNVLDI